MLYWLATTLLLTFHLLAMNLAAGGPVVAAWLLGRGDDGRVLATRLAGSSAAALAWGSLLGGVTLLIPNPALRAAMARFPASAYWFAAIEALFSLACVVAIWRCGAMLQRRRWLAWLLAVASSTNLLYHFPPWLAVLGRLTTEPAWGPRGMLERPDVLALINTGEPIALTVHISLASLAVPAMVAMWMWIGSAGRRREPDHAARVIPGLSWWALAPTLLQLPAGIWLLVAASPGVRRAVMGGDAIASACFLASLPTALLLTQRLATLALGDADAPNIRRAAWLMLATVTLMTGALRAARDADVAANARRAHASVGPSPVSSAASERSHRQRKKLRAFAMLRKRPPGATPT